ncbi:MAG: ABC transporter permease [Bacteroidota bacterium]
MNEKYLLNLGIAFEAIQINKIRSLLTALGIVFGVAAVIAMLAVGNGAKQEILEQIKLVGVDNIVITPVVERNEGEVPEKESDRERKYSPGLTLMDARSIFSILPTIDFISPEIIIETNIIREGHKRSGRLVGVEPGFFKLSDFQVQKGNMFNEHQLLCGEQVCIIGHGIMTRFFRKEDPIGKYIKCGPIWLKVTGVLKEKNISDKAIADLGIRDFNMDVYAPVKTVLIRYKNRALVNERKIREATNEDNEGENKPAVNYHQLDRLVVRVTETEYLTSTAEIISRILKRRHNDMVDFEIKIPELLLEQKQRTKDIFNIVLGAIASISLLIGGIGIMNIMLASVLERIKEIGIRRSMGATKRDIVQQFMMEAVLISLTGGMIGIVLGITLALLISKFSDITTIISWSSIVVSFVVAVSVGLIFGIAPAKKAAEQDPVVSLRHE